MHILLFPKHLHSVHHPKQWHTSFSIDNFLEHQLIGSQSLIANYLELVLWLSPETPAEQLIGAPWMQTIWKLQPKNGYQSSVLNSTVSSCSVGLITSHVPDFLDCPTILILFLLFSLYSLASVNSNTNTCELTVNFSIKPCLCVKGNSNEMLLAFWCTTQDNTFSRRPKFTTERSYSSRRKAFLMTL